MKLLPLLCSLLLLVACSSNSAAPREAESKYSERLPALGSGVEEASEAEPVVERETGYSREFVLEEEVVETARNVDSPRSERDLPSSARNASASNSQTSAENSSRVNMPPLDKTYTLQLAAFRDTQQALDYAQRYNIDPEQAGVARILSKGQFWYVLAYGVYITRGDAEQAKSQLQAQGVPEPWIRTLAALEELSKAANQSD